MSGQVVGFVRSAHQVAFELLPWFVNGTLEPAERTAVEQHLHECVACRRELDWLQQLSSAYVSSEPALDSEGAFERLVPQLQRQDAPVATPSPFAWLRSRLSDTGAWLRFAVAMQFGVIAALGWAVALRELPYHGLGAIATRASGSVIVVFDPNAREGDVRRILRAIGARVVDGPTTANGYVLEMTDAAGTTAAALAQLRAEPAVILAEPLQVERVP
ncbi:MAG TPA: zf-HC2 domain-containing protein [Burkholderiaceae bacterium]|nr:zf-HC2 domain-containing protein [Burkholderiaceae bacterium]